MVSPKTSKNAGRFVVIEGMDGAGTTTHSKKLSEWLSAQGQSVHLTCEPTQGALGQSIRAMIQRTALPSWQSMALLFAADRALHVEQEIMPKLNQGSWVVCDRYDYSSVAYQSVMAEEPNAIEWIKTINAYAPRPDLTLVLDIPLEVAKARLAKRTEQLDAYEREPMITKLAEFYLTIERWFERDKIVHLSSDRPSDEVAQEIRTQVSGIRS